MTFYKFGHLLDAVTTSGLVIYDVGNDDVVLVLRSQERQDNRGPRAAEGMEKQGTVNVKPGAEDPRANPDRGSRVEFATDKMGGEDTAQQGADA
ncbi:hypothetical protein GGS20DRAFT_590576 [Poronia punctata]|nr:hypothetical protein GGS20DRAFT_590576 [Poronia punctata]